MTASAPDQPLETPFNRFVGAVIDDGIWFAAFGFVFGYLPQSFYEDHAGTVGLMFIVFCSLWLNYFAISESKWGMSLGKKVMGMRVLGEDGRKASFGACSIRNVLRPLDYLLIGPLMIANTERRQRLGDKLGHTIVVNERQPTRPAPPPGATRATGEDAPLTDREHVRLAEPAAEPAAAPSPVEPVIRSAAIPGSDSGFGGVGRRSGAFAIDAVVVGSFALFALASFSGLYEDHPELYGLVLVVIATLCFNYFVICEWKWGGKTLGKRAVGLKVVADDGGPVSFASASMRNLLRLVDFFFLLIGPILILGTTRRQRLGDQVAHTLVVRHDWAPGETATAAAAPPPCPAADPPQGGNGEDSERGRLPEVDWSLKQTIWGVAGGLFLAAFIAPLLIVPFDTDLSSIGATLAAQALLTWALVGTALYVAGRREAGGFVLRSTLERLGWRRFKAISFAWMLAAYVAYLFLVGLYVVIFGAPEQEDIAEQLGLDRGLLLAGTAVFLICVVAPIAEETFFRGFVFGGLRGRLSRLPAALISGLIFGGVHAPSGPSAVIPLAIFGTILALLYEQTGSIWPGVMVHAANNVIAISQ